MMRQEAMGVLARANLEELRGALGAWPEPPDAESLRGPEAGLIMLRGRAGGGGAPFNLGEATVARATVRLSSGEVGFSCVLGRDLEKARLAALFDALWQREAEVVDMHLLTLVRERLAGQIERTAEETAATRVNFFTMIRGEDE
ncbi:alpha-D-ribose 1-methylphosphonate 5-triphosphate synthase subunit PhnG [Breoghania corrubedonensis]|uniref:Alpha-D-ribose 1-methylphosphonate 5-triphosphate synthase subunit PhnG n=1 Tax=Breoghania corrubedonensis TaxID=665038 RepID=A0A2T5VFE1_9HYPH|nr:phosphonate C-P lyase system protein PhnG [Breoghania corrubedonensis]PTW62485.1 alpha-D-ribose 1-methylphosphonate 5-triphosphate synthase subunit PhnG [Breoghania corrubedonensis]